MAVASSFAVNMKPPSPLIDDHRHVAAAHAGRRARWQSPSRDCPGSRATGTCAACRPGKARRAAKPIWVTSSTKMPSSGSSARIASRKATLRRELWSSRSRQRACRSRISAVRERRLALCAGSASISRRRIGAASPTSATAGACSRPAPPDRSRRGSPRRRRRCPIARCWHQHARADREHHVGLRPELVRRAAASR